MSAGGAPRNYLPMISALINTVEVHGGGHLVFRFPTIELLLGFCLFLQLECYIIVKCSTCLSALGMVCSVEKRKSTSTILLHHKYMWLMKGIIILVPGSIILIPVVWILLHLHQEDVATIKSLSLNASGSLPMQHLNRSMGHHPILQEVLGSTDPISTVGLKQDIKSHHLNCKLIFTFSLSHRGCKGRLLS